MAGNERWHINQRHCHHLMLPKPALELPQSLRAAITAICIGRWDLNSFPRSKREMMNLPLQQRSWQGTPEPGVFMELSFRAEQGVINLVKTFSNQTISSPNVHTKNQLSKFQSTVEESSALCTQYFWECCTTPLHTISHGSNWDENYSGHFVLECSRGSVRYLMTQGLQACSTPESALEQALPALWLWYFWILAWTRLLIICFRFFTEIGH